MTNTPATPTATAPAAPTDDSCCGSSTGAAALAEPLRPEDEELAVLAKALAHPVRILILRNLLRIGACYFGRLADLLPVAPSTASQHLTVLKDAGLVRGEIEGERPCYCVDLPKLRRIQHLVGNL